MCDASMSEVVINAFFNSRVISLRGGFKNYRVYFVKCYS